MLWQLATTKGTCPCQRGPTQPTHRGFPRRTGPQCKSHHEEKDRRSCKFGDPREGHQTPSLAQGRPARDNKCSARQRTNIRRRAEKEAPPDRTRRQRDSEICVCVILLCYLRRGAACVHCAAVYVAWAEDIHRQSARQEHGSLSWRRWRSSLFGAGLLPRNHCWWPLGDSPIGRLPDVHDLDPVHAI